MPTSIDHPAASNQRLGWYKAQQADEHQPNGVVHLVLDGRVERRKLLRRQAATSGRGPEGTQAHGQGRQQATEGMKTSSGLHELHPLDGNGSSLM